MRLSLRATQRVVMTPLLQQAIQLLQLSTLELEQVVRKELEENPLLEELPEEKQEVDGEVATATAADGTELAPAPAPTEPASKETSSVDGERADDLPFDLTSAVFDQQDERTPVSTEEREDLPFENLGRTATSLAEHLEEQLRLASAEPRRVANLHGDGIGLGVGGELEEETLLDAPRGHPRGVEALDDAQGGLDFLGGHSHPLGDLVHPGAEVAVLVEIADDGLPDGHHPRVVRGQPQLLLEVLGERGGRAPEVLEGQVLALLRGDGRPLVLLVEDGRGQIEGQIVRALLVDGGGLLGLRLGGSGSGGDLRSVRGGGRGRLAVHLLLLFGQLLEQRVLLQLLAHHLLELERGQLQELDGLLEERGHGEPLPLLHVESHRHRSPQGSTLP